jgi:predicted metal-dependent hydrolase
MIENVPIEIIRSSRRTLGMEIKTGGRVIVRAPYRASNADIKRFIDEHEAWLIKHLKKMKEAEENLPSDPLTNEEINKLADEAMVIIPQRCAYYAELLGVDYGRITIRNQATRWGSCTKDGNLNFNCLLMLAPPEVLDSVVVHELCHRLEMNHSKRFYEKVYSVFPDYKKWDKWLKTNSDALLRRML